MAQFQISANFSYPFSMFKCDATTLMLRWPEVYNIIQQQIIASEASLYIYIYIMFMTFEIFDMYVHNSIMCFYYMTRGHIAI